MNSAVSHVLSCCGQALGVTEKPVTFVAGLCVLGECLSKAHATVDLSGDTEPWGRMYTPENAWLPDQAAHWITHQPKALE